MRCGVESPHITQPAREPSLEAGVEPDNLLVPATLHDFDQQILRTALTQARWLQRRIAADYGVAV